MKLRRVRMHFTVSPWPARKRLNFEQAVGKLFREKGELLERLSRT